MAGGGVGEREDRREEITQTEMQREKRREGIVEGAKSCGHLIPPCVMSAAACQSVLEVRGEGSRGESC